MPPPLIREPIGLRVLVQALRREDDAPLRLWRADTQTEADALLERGQDEACAVLWAALLRWSEAEAISAELQAQGWQIRLHGVRAITLARAVALLHPPRDNEGWMLVVAGLRLRAVPTALNEDEGDLARLLAFLDA